MNLSSLIEKRTRLVGGLIAEHLNEGERILDFGCGDMQIPAFITGQKSVRFTGVDVIDYSPEGELEFEKIEADQRLRFDDASFDVSVACFALHHTNDPDFFFDELVRVSRKRVVLLEDTFNTWIGKIRTQCIDRIYNSNFLIKHVGGGDMNIPYNFKSVKDWKALVNDRNLTLKTFQRIYPHPIPFVPSHNVLIVIEKP